IAGGWIRRRGNVGVKEPATFRVGGRITIAIGCVVGGTARSESLAPRRLCVLPDGCRGKAAGGWRRRSLRKGAAGRRRARVVINPEDHRARAEVRPNVLCGGDLSAATFIDGHRGAIHASTKTGNLQHVPPGTYIFVIIVGKSATFFDVEKDDRSVRKSLSAREIGCGISIHNAHLASIRCRLQLAALSAVEQHEKAKALGGEQCAFSLPGAAFFASRRT